MNDEFVAQFALLENVLSNWDGIRVRMGVLSPALEGSFAKIAEALAKADTPERIAIAIDRLVDLTSDTAAQEYVRQLIRRSELADGTSTRSGAGALMVSPEIQAFDFAPPAAGATQRLAHSVGVKVLFKPVTVYFATNRAPNAEAGSDGEFGTAHSDLLTLGQIGVTIPVAAHRAGNIEHPSFGTPDKTKHFVLEKPVKLSEDLFLSALTKSLDAAPRKELLIFLHGYKTTFEEAARRAAQIAEDTGFGGSVVLFSWPSAGAYLRYPADEERAGTAAKPFLDFLNSLESGPWEKVHLLAHSMGNRVLVAGLAKSEKLNLPIQNVIFAAADVYVDMFKQEFSDALESLNSPRPLFTSYASRADLALILSSVIHGGARIGRFDGDVPFTTTGLQTIDATNADTALLSLHHGYFGDRPCVLTDIGYMIAKGLSASERVPLKPERQWWRFS